jgi:hypothetical protein
MLTLFYDALIIANCASNYEKVTVPDPAVNEVTLNPTLGFVVAATNVPA